MPCTAGSPFGLEVVVRGRGMISQEKVLGFSEAGNRFLVAVLKSGRPLLVDGTLFFLDIFYKKKCVLFL